MCSLPAGALFANCFAIDNVVLHKSLEGNISKCGFTVV